MKSIVATSHRIKFIYDKFRNIKSLFNVLYHLILLMKFGEENIEENSNYFLKI